MGTWTPDTTVVILMGVALAIMFIVILSLAYARMNARPARTERDSPAQITVTFDGAAWVLYRIDMYLGHYAWVDVSGRLYEVNIDNMTARRLLPLVPMPNEIPDTGPAALAGVSSDDPYVITPSSWAELFENGKMDIVGTLMDSAHEDGLDRRAVPSEWTVRAERRVRNYITHLENRA